MSRTPSSKYSRSALTVPTMTLLPRTHSRLILSAGTSTFRSPPVTLDRTRTPFLARPCMLSNTTGERVARRLEDHVEWPVLSSRIEDRNVRRRLVACADGLDQVRVEVRLP